MRDTALESIAVGFFDGVHLGHRAILENAASALTFSNHPLTVLAPARAPRLIMGLEERLAAIGCPTEVLDFTQELAAMTPDEFAVRYLRGRKVRCGPDWRFGRNGEGDDEWLRRHGYEVEVVGFAEYNGERISSSRIRTALSQGAICDVNAMLGRQYRLEGKVVAGKGLGHTLGYPTVNVEVAPNLALAPGVYAVEAGGCRALANYGYAPTMGAQAWKIPVLEVHFLSGVPQCGEIMSVEFLEFVRFEREFGSVEELKSQIYHDIMAINGIN